LFNPDTTTTGDDGSAEATAGHSAAAVRHAPDAATNAPILRRERMKPDKEALPPIRARRRRAASEKLRGAECEKQEFAETNSQQISGLLFRTAQKMRNQGGPPGLMAGAQALTGIAVKIFAEREVVAPERIRR
jgi:hypothetical protein